MFIRMLNPLLGLWLFASAFLLSRAPAPFINMLVVSLAVMAIGMASILGRHRARRVNAVLGGWLFLSALIIPQVSTGVMVHQIVMGVLLVITALFPHVHYQGTRTAA
jgi:hypothetical protein